MKPDTAKRVMATGFRVIQTLDLVPGRYNLRVGVREGNTRKAGSVTFDLEVPDFLKAPLTMSDIALTSALKRRRADRPSERSTRKMLPGPLSSYREFATVDEIALFAEIYDNVKQPHKVEITATAKAEADRPCIRLPENHDSSELAGSAGGYGFQTRIPLKASRRVSTCYASRRSHRLAIVRRPRRKSCSALPPRSLERSNDVDRTRVDDGHAVTADPDDRDRRDEPD
jgi:hypothetical protein